MATLGVTEKETFEICRKYNLLSPLYNTGIGRDGCFFCPNAATKERELLKQEYPELVKEIYKMIAKTNVQCVLRYKNRNNWIKDYLENNGSLEKLEQEQKEQKNDITQTNQISLFDILKN